MKIKTRIKEQMSAHPEVEMDITRQIAEKSRFGVTYYLIGLTGICLITPQLPVTGIVFTSFFVVYLLLYVFREYTYRLAQYSDYRMAWARYCTEASFLINTVFWLLFAAIVFRSEHSLSAASTATIMTTAGLATGGVISLAPDWPMIRRFSILKMAGTGVMLPFFIADSAVWYFTTACIVYLVFLFRIAQIQCHIYWQLIESNQNLQQQTRALISAQMEALASTRAKSEFLAKMSHEIRTPMNGVIGVTELLASAQLDEAQKKDYLNIIRDAGTTLMAIIDDILDFSKLEAQKMVLVQEPVNINALVQDLETLFSIQLKDSAVQLSYQHGELPEWISADPARLRQLLFNLIGNAIKFTPTGSIAIEVKFTPHVTDAWGHLHISVTDTGIGIAQEHHSRIFGEFEQINNSVARKGTGLGLTICKYLVDLMGGKIGFQSEANVGSCFWFELPVQIVQSPSLYSSQSPNLSPGDALGAVLLVEDNNINQTVACGMLRHCLCEVSVVSTGEAAIEAVKQNEFGLVLMDCDLPGIDGITATRRIRDWETQQQRPHTPIVALTAHIFEGERQRCIEAGMNDFLSKPLHLNDLQAIIQRWNTNPSKEFS